MEVYDDDQDDRPDFIGSFKTTLRELTSYKTNSKYFLINKAKDGGFFYSYSGILHVVQADAIQPPKPKVEEKKEPVQPTPQPQQPVPYYPIQPPTNQSFTISVSSGPSGFNISMGTNASPVMEPQRFVGQPGQPTLPPTIQPLQTFQPGVPYYNNAPQPVMGVAPPQQQMQQPQQQQVPNQPQNTTKG